MSDGGLERECRVFAHYLLGVGATTYQVEKYVAAHAADPAYARSDRFGRWLVGFARHGVARTWLADAYARRVTPRTLLRRKLVLLLAILETTAPSHRRFELTRARGPLTAVLTLGAGGTLAVAITIVSVAVLGPVHLLLRGGASE